jgi:hypothetical protein
MTQFQKPAGPSDAFNGVPGYRRLRQLAKPSRYIAPDYLRSLLLRGSEHDQVRRRSISTVQDR